MQENTETSLSEIPVSEFKNDDLIVPNQKVIAEVDNPSTLNKKEIIISQIPVSESLKGNLAEEVEEILLINPIQQDNEQSELETESPQLNFLVEDNLEKVIEEKLLIEEANDDNDNTLLSEISVTKSTENNSADETMLTNQIEDEKLPEEEILVQKTIELKESSNLIEKEASQLDLPENNGSINIFEDKQKVGVKNNSDENTALALQISASESENIDIVDEVLPISHVQDESQSEEKIAEDSIAELADSLTLSEEKAKQQSQPNDNSVIEITENESHIELEENYQQIIVSPIVVPESQEEKSIKEILSLNPVQDESQLEEKIPPMTEIELDEPSISNKEEINQLDLLKNANTLRNSEEKLQVEAENNAHEHNEKNETKENEILAAQVSIPEISNIDIDSKSDEGIKQEPSAVNQIEDENQLQEETTEKLIIALEESLISNEEKGEIENDLLNQPEDNNPAKENNEFVEEKVLQKTSVNSIQDERKSKSKKAKGIIVKANSSSTSSAEEFDDNDGYSEEGFFIVNQAKGSENKEFSDNLEKLLNELNLMEEDLQRVGIDLNTLEFSLNPIVYGKTVHFLMSISLILSLLRWPWVQKNGINTSRIKFSKRRLSALVDVTTDEPVELERNWENVAPLRINENDYINSYEDIENGVLSLREDSPLKPVSDKTNGIIFTPYSLLLGSQIRLRGVFATNAFYETVKDTFDMLWSALVSSLIIQGIYNYRNYPAERGDTNLLDVLGISALFNMFCIKSLNNFACFRIENEREYDVALASALNENLIWPFLAGIPLLFGIIQSLRALREAKALDDKQIAKTIQKLKDHKPSFRVDTLGWVISIIIPDLFAILMPLATLFELIPQPGIKMALEKISAHLIWDGRLSNEQRQQLFDELLKFSRQHTQLTQMKAMSILADIVEGIQVNNLLLLKEAGVNDETITTLLFIKTRALQQLQNFAGHLNSSYINILPQTPTFFQRLFADYLLWTLGHPENIAPQILFYAYRSTKMFFWLMFYKAVLTGIYDKFNLLLEEQRCNAAGKSKVWHWIEAWQNYSCTVCGDLPTYIDDVNSPSSCLSGYLNTPRILEELLTFIDRFSTIDSDFVLDLSSQTKLIKAGNLTIFLNNLKTKMPKIGIFYLVNNFLNVADIAAIVNFLKNSSVENLYLNNGKIVPEGIKILADSLVELNLNRLNLISSNLNAINAIVLAQGLKNSSINVLDISGNFIGDEGIKEIANNFNGKVLNIKNCRITSKGCIALAKAFLRLGNSIYLDLSGNPIDSACAKALSQVLSNLITLTIGSGGYIDDVGISAFAEELQKSNSTLNFLELTGYNVSDTAISALINALPNSGLYFFNYTDNQVYNKRNYTNLILHLISSLNQSKIYGLGWRGNEIYGFGDREAILFAESIEKSLFNRLGILDLSNNQIGPIGMQAFAQVLSKTYSLVSLLLRNNKIGAGVLSLLGNLNSPNGYSFDFSNNGINTTNVYEFTQLINITTMNIFELDLSNNPIGNEGVTDIIKAFGGTLERLILINTGINVTGAKNIANLLIKYNHDLWINDINSNKKDIPQLATTINRLNLAGNFLSDEGVKAICNVLPYTKISPANFIFDTKGIRPEILENCGVAVSASEGLKVSSGANSLHYDLFYPYVLLYRIYRASQKSVADILLAQYHKLRTTKTQSESKYQHTVQVNYPIHLDLTPFSHSPQQIFSLLDASNHQGSETIVINLDANLLIQSIVYFSENIDAIIGSSHSNNVLIGNQNTFIDIYQSRGNNLLVSGKNNLLRLGFFGRDHIVIRPEQGTIKIVGFNHRDVLHILDNQIIYSDSTPSCYEIHSSAILQFRGTEVQLTNTHCNNIVEQIRFNNQTALEEAQTEVFQHNTPYNTWLYNNLLGICETFVNSVSKSALLTAAPVFIAEIVYRAGIFNRQDAEAFGQKMQAELMLAYSDSPHVIAASWLASRLASELINSPQIVAMTGISVSIVISVLETVLGQNASCGLMVLQMGAAMLGSVAGNIIVQKLPEISTWGLNKVSKAKNYASNTLTFWYKKSSGGKGQEFLENGDENFYRKEAEYF